MIEFFNEKGQKFGNVQKGMVFNTSFEVGKVDSKGINGGKIYNRDKGGARLYVGHVLEDGSILHVKDGMPPHLVSAKGTVSNKERAKILTIGRVEVNADVGIVYDNNGVKAGEVRNAGEDTKVYGGALMALLVNIDPKNAPYSHAQKKYKKPAPPV